MSGRTEIKLKLPLEERRLRVTLLREAAETGRGIHWVAQQLGIRTATVQSTLVTATGSAVFPPIDWAGLDAWEQGYKIQTFAAAIEARREDAEIEARKAEAERLRIEREAKWLAREKSGLNGRKARPLSAMPA